MNHNQDDEGAPKDKEKFTSSPVLWAVIGFALFLAGACIILMCGIQGVQ